MTTAPSATATFLFTDIEGSTLLLKQFRERYHEILDEQQRLLQEAFAAHGGKVIDTQGDAFFVAFRRAKDGVLAAAAGQQALAAHDWPAGGELRVRMGIHTGEATVIGNRYVGLSVHRAARICAGGYGGQVLVSQTTVTVLEDDEETIPGVSLRDLGPQRLKDFERPIRVYQLDIAGLPRAYPPLRTRVPPRLTRARLLSGGLVAALIVAAVAAALIARSDHPAIVPGSLVRIDPATNEVTDVIKIDDEPELVLATRGYVWVAHNIFPTGSGATRASELSRIDMKSHSTTVVGGGLAPCGLTAGPAGDVWVVSCTRSEERFRGTIVRVDAATLQLEEILEAPSTAEFVYRGLAYGGGSLWIGDPDQGSYAPQAVTRIDRVSHARRSIRVGSRPAEMAWRKGTVWVANLYDDSVSRIDGRTNTVDTLQNLGGRFGAFSLTTSQQVVWVGSLHDHRVVRIDRRAFRYDGAVTLPVKRDSPIAWLAVGAGSVWATTPRDHAVWRIDPATNQAMRIPLKYRPRGVAVGGGAVWVAIDDED